MAESEGIDIERLRREEMDAELARKVASEQEFDGDGTGAGRGGVPGSWREL